MDTHLERATKSHRLEGRQISLALGQPLFLTVGTGRGTGKGSKVLGEAGNSLLVGL